MLKSIITILLCTLGVASAARAETWRTLRGDRSEAFFVEMDHHPRSATGVKVWFMKVTAKPYSPMTGLYPARANVEQTLGEFECPKARWRVLRVMYFDARMSAVADTKASTSGWMSIPRGSIGEALSQIACGGAKVPRLGTPFPSRQAAVGDYFSWIAKQ